MYIRMVSPIMLVLCPLEWGTECYLTARSVGFITPNIDISILGPIPWSSSRASRDSRPHGQQMFTPTLWNLKANATYVWIPYGRKRRLCFKQFETDEYKFRWQWNQCRIVYSLFISEQWNQIGMTFVEIFFYILVLYGGGAVQA